MPLIDKDLLSFVPGEDTKPSAAPDKDVLDFATEGEQVTRKEIATLRQKAAEKQETEQERMAEFARKRLDEAWFPNLKATAVGLGSGLLGPLARGVGADETADMLNRFGSAYRQAAAERDEEGVVPPIIKRGLRGVGETLPTMIVSGAAAGPYGPILVAATQETDKAITEGKDAGLTGGKLAAYAVGHGAIEGGVASVFQKVGLGGAEKMAGGKTAVAIGVADGLKKLGIATAQELPEELITELGHNVAAAVGGVDPNAMSLPSLLQTAADTTVQTLMTMGIVGSPTVASAAKRGKQIRIENEIIAASDEGRVPSRTQWRKWGLDKKVGESRKARKAALSDMADAIRSARQATTAPQPAATAALEEAPQTAAPEVVTEAAPQAAQEAAPEEQAVMGAATRVAQEVAPEVTQEALTAPEPEPEQEASGLAPMRHDTSVEAEGTGEVIGARQVVQDIASLWEAPVRRGRLGHSKARGLYKPRLEVVRLGKGEESSPSVIAHEMAHHFDNTSSILKGAPPQARGEVGRLDYDQTQQRDTEGFAEFVNAYVTGSTMLHKDIDLKAAVPSFYAHFETWLDANPTVKERVLATREIVTRWRNAGAVGRVKGQISKTGKDVPVKQSIGKWVSSKIDRLYSRWFEKGWAIKKFTDEAKAKGYKPAADEATPFEDFNALRAIGPHYAERALTHGVFRLKGIMDLPTQNGTIGQIFAGALVAGGLDPNVVRKWATAKENEKIGPSMHEVLEEIGDDEDYSNAMAWMYARHAAELWSRNIPKNPAITLEDANEVVKRLYDPRYERMADKLKAFNDSLIFVLADTGVLNTTEAVKILTSYKYYMPLERAKSGKPTGLGGRKIVDLSAAIKVRRGGGLQIVDPVESTLARTMRLYERAAKQIIVNKLVEVNRGTHGLGEHMEPVPQKIIQQKLSFEEIKKRLAELLEPELGPDVDDILDNIDPMAALAIWRPDMTKTHSEPIVRVTVKGEPRFYQLSDELNEALGGVEAFHDLDYATKIMSRLTRVLKKGATRLNPFFVVPQGIRDWANYLYQGERGVVGIFDPIRFGIDYICSEVAHAMGKTGNPVVEAWQRAGGELSTFIGLDRDKLKDSVKRARKGKQGIGATAMSILGVTEAAPRVAEYAATLDKLGWLDRVKQGEEPPLDVSIKAINAAHDVTTDFRRFGVEGERVNHWIAFFNPRIQGLDKFARTWKDNPGRSIFRLTIMALPVSLAYWWLRHDDDDYKERPEWQDSFWIIRDRNGDPTIRIPKPQEWGWIYNGIERALDFFYDKDPEAVERGMKHVLTSVNPMGLPSGVTPVAEAAFNYDISFRHRPIVSDAKKKLEPRMQYYDYTSAVAKTFANFMHEYSGGRIQLSPAKIDHIANGLTGGLFGNINAPITKFVEGKPQEAYDWSPLRGLTFRKEYPKSVDDFYAEKEKADKAHNTKKARGEKESTEDLRHWQKLQYVAGLMTDMREASSSLPKDEKDATGVAMTGLARAALGRPALERYPNPMADPSVVPGAVASAVRKHIAQKAITASAASPRSRDDAAMATVYLQSMGVNGNVAQNVAYTRLKSQGLRSDTAKRRAIAANRIFP